MRLTSFRIERPRCEAAQDDILSWLVDAHTRAAMTSSAEDDKNASTGTSNGNGKARVVDEVAVRDRMRRLVRHVCCGRDRIAMRGYSAPELTVSGETFGTAMRTDAFACEVDAIFERLYADEQEPPDDLIHVTCTGYVSPSGAQRIVSSKGWGDRTRVTHAYHMGCYASVPALEIAGGCLAPTSTRKAPTSRGDDHHHRHDDRHRRVDIVHTELCSLHFDPRQHTPEQLVVQSLFADGSVRYRVTNDDGSGATADDKSTQERGLHVLALHELLVQGSEDQMQWRLGDHGMRMSLARDLPIHIGRMIRPFISELFARAGFDLVRERASCAFAVHPGGPKIIDSVRDALELRDDQVASSRRVLKRYGNMSSATLPHIWSDMLDDDASVPSGTLIGSVAFGPGLTICGAVFRKE